MLVSSTHCKPFAANEAFIKGLVYTDEEWCGQNIRLLSAHRFHTPYGRTVVERRKQQNISRLEAIQRLIQNSNAVKLLNAALSESASIEITGRTLNTFLKTSASNAINFLAERA